MLQRRLLQNSEIIRQQNLSSNSTNGTGNGTDQQLQRQPKQTGTIKKQSVKQVKQDVVSTQHRTEGAVVEVNNIPSNTYTAVPQLQNGMLQPTQMQYSQISSQAYSPTHFTAGGVQNTNIQQFSSPRVQLTSNGESFTSRPSSRSFMTQNQTSRTPKKKRIFDSNYGVLQQHYQQLSEIDKAQRLAIDLNGSNQKKKLQNNSFQSLKTVSEDSAQVNNHGQMILWDVQGQQIEASQGRKQTILNVRKREQQIEEKKSAVGHQIVLENALRMIQK